MEIMTVNEREYRVIRLLGKGKGGYSYLVTDGAGEYVLKQIHHEPCAYYTFTDKLASELRDYDHLRELGIPVKLLGHRYIYDALLSVRDNQLCVRGAMDELYRYIASRHGTTPPRVERNIRNAIEIAFDRCTPEILEKHFGNTVRFDRGKPTNSEFLSIIAEKLTLETRESSDPDRDMFLSRSMY